MVSKRSTHQSKMAAPPLTRAPPDGGYGWLIVVLSFCNLYLACSCQMSFPVLFVVLTHSFHTSNSSIALVGSMQIAFTFYIYILVGPFIKRYGCRAVGIFGGFTIFLGLFLSSFARSVNVLIFTYGVLTGMGVSVCSSAGIIIVQQYFDKRRGLAGGLAICGFGVGCLTAAPLLDKVVEVYGWRGALLVHSAVMLHTIPFSAAFRPLPSQTHLKIYKHNSKPVIEKMAVEEYQIQEKQFKPNSHESKHTADEDIKSFCSKLWDFKLWSKRSFLLCCVGNFFSQAGIMTFYQHLVNCAIYKHIPGHSAALLPAFVGGTSIVARVICSIFADSRCVNRLFLYAMSTIGGGIVAIFIICVNTFIGMSVITTVFGIFYGINMALHYTILTDLVGVDRLPNGSGIQGIFIGSGVLLASPMLGRLVDVMQSYEIPISITGALQVLGGFFILMISILKWTEKKTQIKLTEVDEVESEHCKQCLTSKDIEANDHPFSSE